VPGTDGSLFEFVKPHGRGVLEYANGNRYAGGWEEGRPHGAGMLVKTDGTAEYGHWERGVQVEVTERI
jgi:1-phosphatidylinositol-4-phosphate 5-kinase